MLRVQELKRYRLSIRENLRSTWRAEKPQNSNGTGGVFGKIYAPLGVQKNRGTQTVPVEYSGKSTLHLACRKTVELNRYRWSFQKICAPLGVQKADDCIRERTLSLASEFSFFFCAAGAPYAVPPLLSYVLAFHNVWFIHMTFEVTDNRSCWNRCPVHKGAAILV